MKTVSQSTTDVIELEFCLVLILSSSGTKIISYTELAITTMSPPKEISCALATKDTRFSELPSWLQTSSGILTLLPLLIHGFASQTT